MKFKKEKTELKSRGYKSGRKLMECKIIINDDLDKREIYDELSNVIRRMNRKRAAKGLKRFNYKLLVKKAPINGAKVKR